METLVLLVFLAVIAGPVLALIAISMAQSRKRDIHNMERELAALQRRLATLENPRPAAEAVERGPLPEKKQTIPKMAPPPLPAPAVSPARGTATPAKAVALKPEGKSTAHQVKKQPETEPEIAASASQPSHPTASRKINWQAWLRRLHLWPPEQETSGEIGLAAWWTTRIGILVGVIAVVFLGVYVNRMTAPWIRFVELLAISGGVYALGWWLERRWGRFGDLVSIGGLAMFYFTAYAAHGVPAVQITSQAWLGALFQIIALATMLVWSDRKRDGSLAAAAIFLGYVTCAFSANHGLPMMTLAGLVLLGMIGSLLHAFRGWRLPIATAVGGSYAGLLLFSITHQEFLSLFQWIAATIALLTSFSVSLWKRGHSGATTRWEKRLAVIQGTLAAVVLLAGAWLIAPGQLHLVYLTLCIAFAAHAWLSWSGHFMPALFPTWFLKASTFLTLYLAAKFDGPTLWLSLSAQGLGTLWTMRQRDSGHRWLALGFITLWGIAFLVYAQDASKWSMEPFHLGDPRRLTAWVYLIAATLTASLFHQGWWTTKQRAPGRERECGLVMAVVTGIGFILSLLSSGNPIAPLFVAAGLIGILMELGRWRRSIIPLLSGAAILLAGHLRLWTIDLPDAAWWPLATVGVLLGLAGFLMAHQAITFQGDHSQSKTVRITWGLTTSWIVLVLTSGCVLGWQGHLFWAGGGVSSTTIALIATLCGIIGSRRLLGRIEFVDDTKEQDIFRGGLNGVIGLVLAGFSVLTSEALLVPWILLGTVGILVLLMGLTRDKLVSTSIIGPAFMGTGYYLFPQALPAWPLWEDLGLGLVLMTALAVAAWRIHQSIKDSTALNWIGLDALLQGASLLVFFQGTSRHMDGAWHWLLMSSTTLLLLVAARRLPFPSLKWVAWLPATLVILSDILLGHSTGLVLSSSFAYWLGAALLVVSWQFESRSERRLHGIGIGLSATSLSWAALRTLQGGAEFAVLAAIGMGYAIAWHRRGETGTPLAAMAIGGLSILLGFAFLTDIESSEAFGFLWIALASIFIAVQGWLLKKAPSRMTCWRDPVRSWAHASAALLLALVALVTPALGYTEVATPFWGIASVALFLGGLTGGIRAYRMIGLLGLLACLARMFAVDVQNTFYRIIAFAVVGFVLLGVGFLYTRFRDWIESNDERETQSPATS